MLSFQVPSMTCGGCVRAITRAVEAADPGARVEADLARRTVRIVPVNAGPAALQAALRDAGYPAARSAPAAAARGCGCGCGTAASLEAAQAAPAPRSGCCA